MAKVGRPKTAGIYREPNGRESRTKPTINWQRILDAVALQANNSRIGTPLGKLALAKIINTKQADAGERFARERAEADAALGLPPRNCQAQNVNRVPGRSDMEDYPGRVRIKRRAIAAYDKAVDAVGQGSKQLAALEWVVIYEQRQNDYSQLLDLIAGLDRLIKHYAGRGAG